MKALQVKRWRQSLHLMTTTKRRRQWRGGAIRIHDITGRRDRGN